MRSKNNILEDFHLLSDYLWNIGKLEDLNKYKKDFSAFLLHANHIKGYDFVAPFCKNKMVLDVGCFIGYGEARIFSQAKEITAIDSDDKALEFARRNRDISNVKFKKVDARGLPFPFYRFLDIILSNKIKNWLKVSKSKLTKSSGFKNRRIADNHEVFTNLFKKFSMEDFYLENQATDNSMDLFAICTKDI